MVDQTVLSRLLHSRAVQRIKNEMPPAVVARLKLMIPGYHRHLRFIPPRERFLTVVMDLQNSCNLACKMCHFGFLGDYPKEPYAISPANFRRFADNVLTRTEEIAFSPCTEPLMHPQYGELLDILAEYRVPKMWMMTNLNLLTPAIAEKLVAMRFERLLISLDSFRPEVYESIKCKSNFARVIDNIKMVQDIKRRTGSVYPKIHFNFVLMKTTVDNYPGYLDFVESIGGEQVGFFHVVVYQGVEKMRGESMWHHRELYNRFHDQVTADARRTGINIERLPGKFGQPAAPADCGADAGAPLCRYPWYILVVYPQGSFKPCEFWFNQKVWGNLVTDRFEDVWNSEDYRRLRWEVDTRRPSRSCCRNCVSMAALDGRPGSGDAFREIVFE